MNRFITSLLISIFMLSTFIVGFNTYATEQSPLTKEILSVAEPKIIVESYEIVEGELAKGEKVTFNIVIKNTNAYADAYNVLITFTSETDNIRVVDGQSNQYFEEYLAGGDTFEYKLELEVLEYYSTDAMVLDFICTYIGEDATGYQNTTLITPLIRENSKMEINSINVSEQAVVGARSLVNIRYSNTGTLPIQNAKMIIEGDILDSNKEVILEEINEGIADDQ